MKINTMKNPITIWLGLMTLLVTLFATSCSGRVWPHRGLEIDLSRAQVSKQEVVKRIEKFLSKHNVNYAGRGGYDAINGTESVLDFKGSQGLYVSIQMDQDEVVLVYFNQNRRHFSTSATTMFSDLESILRKEWPNAVTRVSR